MNSWPGSSVLSKRTASFPPKFRLELWGGTDVPDEIPGSAKKEFFSLSVQL